ncbi:M61 family metallopeptidase [Corallincola spongiicola]|uniref:M61 family peptidase n=1 Tax=Corallincola spongiicola TaxID=2520508 RepID=A0ABY1WN14_9GAMM|nr:PDZ domain-containing protein [Corallincola spongiicola]TAA43722.1 M61 family peptidase [Corallincola spongiicola]
MLFNRIGLILAFCFTLSFFTTSAGAAEADVKYSITMTDPAHHLAVVSLTLNAEAGALDLYLPVWRSGKYRILPLANGIRQFSAVDAKQQPLNWQKVDKSHWQVEVTQASKVTVSYQLYADMLGDRVRHIDDSHAFLDASGVFMYSPNHRAKPLSVELQVPENWQSRSGMKQLSPHHFVAANYDVLVDSPIETGIHEYHEFSMGDRHYGLLFWGKGNHDSDQVITDLKKLDKAAGELWGDYPFKDYLYMVHGTSGARGATEHLNSTIIQFPWYAFHERKDYIRFISTSAHELIHTWNVKAYRPKGISPYAYQQENYTPLLWIAEGSTSYYDLLLPVRAGVITEKEFLELFAKELQAYLDRPGKSEMSVAEASFDWWIESGGDRGHNHSVSIYGEGALVSWFWDVKLRESSGGDASWDDLHRALYQTFSVSKGEGYEVADVQLILGELSGDDVSHAWAMYVDGTESLEIDPLLKHFGLKTAWQYEDARADAGWQLKEEAGRWLVKQTSRGKSAWTAGLVAGDQILAINGQRLSQGSSKSALTQYQPGDSVVVHYFRRDQLLRSTMVLGESFGKLKLVKDKTASPMQKSQYESWTGQPFTPPEVAVSPEKPSK